MAKVFANRLKRVLPVPISHNQSTLVPRRLITNDVLVAYETLHNLNTKTKGQLGYMALELDMRKACD